MPQFSGAPRHATSREPHQDLAWSVVLAAAGHAEQAERAGVAAHYALDDGRLMRVRDIDAEAVLEWRPVQGWACSLPHTDARRALVDLYLPICSATRARPVTVGHLGESLDGFIAMHTGESQWVTGPENVRHMHRLRALCHAVIVGAGT